MSLGTFLLLVLAALCELIASFPSTSKWLGWNWMTLGFMFVILSQIVTITIAVSPK